MVVDKGEAVPPVRVRSFEAFLLNVPGKCKSNKYIRQTSEEEMIYLAKLVFGWHDSASYLKGRKRVL